MKGAPEPGGKRTALWQRSVCSPQNQGQPSWSPCRWQTSRLCVSASLRFWVARTGAMERSAGFQEKLHALVTAPSVPCQYSTDARRPSARIESWPLPSAASTALNHMAPGHSSAHLALICANSVGALSVPPLFSSRRISQSPHRGPSNGPTIRAAR